MENKVDAKYITDCLIKHYSTHRKWEKYAVFPELQTGTGFLRGNPQRIDLFVMGLIPSLAFEKIAFEIKTSRSDFLSEINKPQKRKLALLFSNLFYFATPVGLVKKDELPPECGLMEIYQNSFTDSKCKISVQAPWREQCLPNWAFIASICRRVATIEKQQNTSLLGS